MSWEFMEKIIVGVLIIAAAVYMAVRAWRSWKSKSSPCSGCAQASSDKGCEGCSFRKISMFLALVLASSVVFAAEPMKLTSPDIRPGDYMRSKFTCQSRNVSPRLEFVNVPDNTKSLALVVHDPDAPSGDRVHWVVFNIPADKFEVAEAIAPGVEGTNDSGNVRWDGPCPPSGTHRYVFEAYALDIMLDLKEGASRAELVQAMEGHVLDKADLVALYEKF
jgi:Raf kinase inhibitor-like YbhB/YbcL family protein